MSLIVRLLVPVVAFGDDVAGGFLTGGERAADDHEKSDEEHRLAEAGAVAVALVDDVRFGVLREDVPLNGKTVQTDHAVKFGDDEEDERPEHARVVRVNTDKVHVEAVRVRQHGDEMREHEDEKEEGRNELNHPKRRVFVAEHLVVSLDVTKLMIRRREAAESAESMDHNAERNEADEGNVKPQHFFTGDEHAAGGVDEVGEEVLADLHRARKGHVAEEEETEDHASDGLGDVSISRGAALTLGILKAGAPNVFGGGRGVGILDGIRGRHLTVLGFQK